MGSLFNRLAVGQRMSEGRFRCEALGEEHAIKDSLALGDFFEGPILLEKPGRGTDNVFANRFQQEVDGLAQPSFIDRPDGHGKCARIFDNKSGFPFLVRAPFETGLPWIEGSSHRSKSLLPDLIVKDEVAEPRVLLEMETEQIFSLSFIPIRCMNLWTDARNRRAFDRQLQQHVNPTGSWQEKHIEQLPFFSFLLDDQAAKRAPGLPEQELTERGKRRRPPHDDGNICAAILADRDRCFEPRRRYF